MPRQALCLLAVLAVALPAQDPRPAGGDARQGPSLDELIASMAERERKLASAEVDMVTSGSYPGGTTFRIERRLRVLGQTHVHQSLRFAFDDGIKSEQETVTTPDGVWMRERDPAFGELFLRMSQELAAKLQDARAVLSASGDAPGQLGNAANELRGAEMLRSLARAFDLRVERRLVQGKEMYAVKGDARAGSEAAAGGDESEAPDHLELLVRPDDLVVVQMVQFRAGRETMRVEITRIDLDVPMQPGDFRLELPEGREFVDVMDHPPAAAQIRHTLEQAEAARAAQRPPGGGEAKAKGDGK